MGKRQKRKKKIREDFFKKEKLEIYLNLKIIKKKRKRESPWSKLPLETL